MLNRQKLLKELAVMADALFIDNSTNYQYAYSLWQQLLKDPLLEEKISSMKTSWPVPVWTDALDTYQDVSPVNLQYHVASVDGSQIYPDRHVGISCYLINIGSVMVHYNVPHILPVEFYSEPYVFTHQDTMSQGIIPSTEYVNGKRQELEFAHGLSFIQQKKVFISDNAPLVLFFDGSLIFWHLEAKDTQLRDLFLPQYISTLEALYAERIPMASYISMPRSRELANIIRLYAYHMDPNSTQLLTQLDWLLDTHVIQFFLQPGQRSQVFKNQSEISRYYPTCIEPYFFYLHSGVEIARIEIPAWIALDASLLDVIASVTLDQMHKGQGYPVVLAEAHEQAVVKGPDRDFFYHVLCKLGIERKQRMHVSQKLMRKRGMGI